MKKWLMMGLALVIALSLIVASCAPAKPVAPQKFTFTFQTNWHTKHPQYAAYVDPTIMPEFTTGREKSFLNRIKKAASDKGYELEFTLYPADQLVKRKMALEGVKGGTLDMLGGSGAYYHGLVPEGDFDWMPYVVAAVGREKFWKWFNSGRMLEILEKVHLEKANAVWLTNVLAGDEGLIALGDKPYKTMEDVKGAKLRVSGGLATRAAEALGCSPVTMATGEIYPALQTGVLDGVVFPIYGLRDYKFIDMCKAYSEPGLFIWGDDLYVNKDKWDSLPKDLQEVFRKVAKEWSLWASTEYWPAYEEKFRVWATEQGCVFYTIPPDELARWVKAVKPAWDWYANESPYCAEMVKLLREFLAKEGISL